MGEIDWRIAKLTDEPDADDEGDKIPKREARAVSQSGDLWLLGLHRLACADACNPAALEALMGGQRGVM